MTCEKCEFLVTSMKIKTHLEIKVVQSSQQRRRGVFGPQIFPTCRTSLAGAVLAAFPSNDKQKRRKTNPREKQRHQNGPKQAPLCSAPGLEFYPHVPI